MYISLFGKGSSAFQENQVKVNDVQLFDPDLILNHAWSPIIFDEGYRKGDNFRECSLAVFDIDNDGPKLSLKTAIDFFTPYNHVIATSRSHQKMKNGKVEDRYRVILFFDRAITRPDEYSKIMLYFKKLFPFVDGKCVDTARFFFPCENIVSEGPGHEVEVDGILKEIELEAKKVKPANVAAATTSPVGNKAQLTRQTLNFLLEGAQPGHWHANYFKAVSNMKECGYSIEETRSRLQTMCDLIGSAGLDEHDEKNLIDIYNRPIDPKQKAFYDSWNTPRIQAREAEMTPNPYGSPSSNPSSPQSFEGSLERGGSRVTATGVELPKLLRPSQGYEDFKTYMLDDSKALGTSTGIKGLDRLLGGGFRSGELTVLMAEAKTGKNTLYHFMLWQGLKAGVFQGYASREIDPFREVLPNLLSLEFKHNSWRVSKTQELWTNYQTKLKEWDALIFSEGYGYFPFEELYNWMSACLSEGVKNFWLDHLHYMLQEPEEHKEASKLIKQIKTMVKELDVHVNLIVQPNKMQDGQRLSLNSLKGGSAIGQTLDNLLILERYKATDEKFISRLTLEVGRHKLCKPGEIYLQYDPMDCSFLEVEKEVKEIGELENHTPDRSITVNSYHRRN